MKNTNRSIDLSVILKEHVKEETYWVEKLGGEWDKCCFPVYNRNQEINSGKMHNLTFQFIGPLFEKLMKLRNGSDPRLFMIMIAGLSSLLFKYTGNTNILLGAPTLKQEDDAEFINTVLTLRSYISPGMTYKELLLQTKNTVLEATANQNYPVERLPDLLNIPYSEGDDFPLFDIALLLENIHDKSYIRNIRVNTIFSFLRTDDCIEGKIEYNPALYERYEVEGIVNHFKCLLENAFAKIDGEIYNLNILLDDEKKKLLHTFNNTNKSYPQKIAIQQLFEEQVERNPGQIAASCSLSGTLTYGELNKKANQLARLLREKGVGPDFIVGIMGRRSLEMAMGILAILKAGGIFLPLDPEYPPNRIKYMLEDSGLNLLIIARIPLREDVTTVIDIEDDEGYARFESTDLKVINQSSDGAYIIYTSGTTGRPKGVVVEHRNAINTLICRKNEYNMDEHTVSLQFFSYSFDGFITSFFTPVISGAEVVLLDDEAVKDIAKIRESIVEKKVTHFICVPSLFREMIEVLNEAELSSLKVVTLAGEKLQTSTIRLATGKKPSLEIVNEYGVTEVAVMSTILRHQEQKKQVSIGSPIWNTRIFILSTASLGSQLQPIGIAGEMCLAGAGVTRGYLNRPDLTQEKFIKDTFSLNSISPMHHMYRTGDLARWLSDGNIEYLGRIDHQVKIRGFRIEPDEIEARMLEHDNISEVVVINKTTPYRNLYNTTDNKENDKRKDDFLYAYYVADITLVAEDLRSFLFNRLPDYMIPTYFIQVEKIPLTPNGKIDSNALPEAELLVKKDKLIIPRDKMEQEVAEIWCNVLEVEMDRVGIDISFFEYGGFSLKATQLINKIHKKFNAKISLIEMFKNPTIRGLTENLKKIKNNPFISLLPVEKKDFYTLSPVQKRLYILNQITSDSTGYNAFSITELAGELDVVKFQACFNALINRHESLRTSFHIVNEKPVQKIHELGEVELKLQHVVMNGQEENVDMVLKKATRIIKDFIKPFDLSQAPLVRVLLIQLEERRNILTIDVHHIVVDGTSLGVLIKEFMILYDGETLPEMKLHYKDYCEWKCSSKEVEAMNSQEQFWMKEFKGNVPVLNLPADYSRPAVQSYEGNSIPFTIGIRPTFGIKELALAEGVSNFMVLLACFNILLSKLSGQDDIVVGTGVEGRQHDDLKNIIGMFVNTLALRNTLKPSLSFRQFLAKLKEKTLDAFGNQDYPFEDIVEKSDVPRDTSRNPLFDVMFQFNNFEASELNITDLKLKPFNYNNPTSKFDITLWGWEAPDDFRFAFEYCTILFKKETIETFSRYFTEICNSVVQNPDQRLEDIRYISEPIKQSMIRKLEEAVKPEVVLQELYHRPLQQVLGASLKNFSSNIAITCGSTTVTYRELERRSTETAHRLRGKGIEPQTHIGVLVDNRIDLIVSMLGIIEARCVFVPLDSAHPKARLELMINSAEIQYVICDSSNLALFSGNTGNFIKHIQFIPVEDLLTVNKTTADYKSLPPFTYSPEDKIYIYFTSGSTGTPKAFTGKNSSLLHFLDWEIDTFNIDEGSRFSQFTNPGFDAFLRDIFTPLLAGGMICIPENNSLMLDADQLIYWIEQSRINLIHCVPSLFRIFNSDSLTPSNFEKLKFILLSGERVIPHQLKNWFDCFSGRIKLVNLWGTSETTLAKTFHFIQENDIVRERVPVGKPIRGAAVAVLDKNLNLCPELVTGELYITTPFRTYGYYNDPKLNGERFIPNPFNKNPDDLWHKTGDLGRVLLDGTIDVMGRNDRQVKIRGIRIELEEIESILVSHHAVKEAVVIKKGISATNEVLWAYIACHQRDETHDNIFIDEITQYLTGKLPEYMLPSSITILEQLPRNPNGKIDFPCLPSPFETMADNLVEPRNMVEKRLLAIWVETLQVEKISVKSRFFELGGNSLHIMALNSKIHKEFDVRIPLKEFFNKPTLEKQAELIQTVLKEKFLDDPFASIKPVEKREFYPLSSAQKRLYVLHQLNFEGNNTVYNMPQTVILHGEVKKDIIEQTFVKILNRHESLRTSFHMVGREPIQRIHDYNDLSFEISFYESGEEEAPKIVDDLVQPFDFAKAPLLRVSLIKIAETNHLLMVDMHHIISDGVSFGILMQDFMDGFSGKDLLPLKVQYKDYSQWQNGEREKILLKNQEKYWLEKFKDGIPQLNLPIDYARPIVQTFEGSIVVFGIGAVGTKRLRDLATAENVTLFMVILAAFYMLLWKLTGQENSVVGTGIEGRRHDDLRQIVGMFINTLSLKNSIDVEKTFREFLQKVTRDTLEAFDCQEYQFEDLVEKIVVKKDTNRNPIFDVLFQFENMKLPEMKIPGLQLNSFGYKKKISKFDLTLFGMEVGDQMEFTFEYNTSLFKKETIEIFGRYYIEICNSIVLNPDQKLIDIWQISGTAKQCMIQKLDEAIKPEVERMEAHRCTIQQVLETSFNKFTSNIAITCGSTTVTYGELQRRSTKAANKLRGKGIEPQTNIGVLIDNRIDLILIMLGIINAGCVFTPLDPTHPMARLELMINSAEIRYIICDSPNLARFSDNEGNLVQDIRFIPMEYFWDSKETPTASFEPQLPFTYSPEDKIYIYFTSGSTGTPKAITGKNCSLLHFLDWEIDTFEIGEGTRFSQLITPGFDAFLRDVFVPLCSGGIICIPGIWDIPLEPVELMKWFEQSAINFVHCGPALFKTFNSSTLTQDNFKALKYVLFSGERVYAPDLTKWFDQLNNRIKFVNLYGPTETTLTKTYHLIEREDLKRARIPVGRPMRGSAVMILDSNMRLCSPLVTGEIYIRTPYATFGYYNNPVLTKEKFLQNPFNPQEEDLIYRTGDMGRILEDGTLDLLGRYDRQVKVRGIRIELEEIEAALVKHPFINEAAVIKKIYQNSKEFLSAFVSIKKEIPPADRSFITMIKEYLTHKLPSYMMPAEIIIMEAIPRKPNGKIDYMTLASLESQDYEYIPPAGKIEIKLAELWKGILGIEKIGTRDDFFARGGNSLNIIVLISKIHMEFDVRIRFIDIFTNPTIKGQAELIRAAQKDIYVSIEPAEKKEYYPLSSAQKRMYVLQKMDIANINYNLPQKFILEGKLNFEQLESVFVKLIQRHDSLNTSFEMIGEEPLQRIHDKVEFAIEIHDARGGDIIDIEKITRNFISTFDLSKRPLFRAGIVKLEEEKQILMIDIHHIITDWVSMKILISDFMALYNGEKFPPLKLQYKDFSEWINSDQQVEKLQQQERYWLEKFAGEIPLLNLPTDFTRPVIKNFEGRMASFEINKNDTETLKNYAIEGRTTLFIVLLSIFNIFLSKICNQEDITVGVPTAGRLHSDIVKIVGMFVNTLALRNFPHGDINFKQFLNEVNGETLEAFDNQDYQYENLVKKVVTTRDTGRNPLTDVFFVFQNIEMPAIDIPGLKLKFSNDYQDISKFDLTLRCYETSEILHCDLEYCIKLFKPETIQRFQTYFSNIVSAVISDKNSLISDIEIMSKEEKYCILHEFNNTSADYPQNKTIHRLFEDQVEQRQDYVALIGQSVSAGEERFQITYKELDEKSNQLAHCLRIKNMDPDAIVAVMIDRSIEMIICLLGILKAGGSYLPIDPDYPSERIDFMLKDSESKIMTTTRTCITANNEKMISDWQYKKNLEIIFLDLPEFFSFPPSLPAHFSPPQPSHLAYIIYTSGTTGQPKGTLIEHRNVVRLLFNSKFQFNFSNIDTWTMFHSFCFDFSVWEMYGALLYGGKLVVISQMVTRDPKRYLEILKKDRITVLNQTPSAFYNLANEELNNSDTDRKFDTSKLDLKYIIFGGEALKPLKLEKWKEKYPDIKLINMFGITETTVHVTYKEIGINEIEYNISNIGKPIPTLTTYVLDKYSKPVPVGVAGELYVGGDGLGRGYLNRTELTKEKFVTNVFKQGDRLYKSGDLARFLENGDMEYLGRIDHQIKIRGFRIELGEIENQLLKKEEIKGAVVVVRNDETGANFLCAYIVPHAHLFPQSRLDFKPSALREYLSKFLPDYMIPAYFTLLEKIPLTANSKIDTKALPAPIIKSDEEYSAPRNDIEKKMVEVWEIVLGVSTIGINDNFFAIGGDSIKTIQIASRLNTFGYKMELRDIFLYPTISHLAPLVKKMERFANQSIVLGNIPLTPIQHWFFENIFPDPHHYNHAVMFYVREGLDKKSVETIFSYLQEHHDALRMTFNKNTDNRKPVQINHGLHYPLFLEEYDLITHENSFNELSRKIIEIQSSINLENGPLMKLGLFHLKDGDRLLIVIHHLVIDGVSWRILFEDIQTLFEQYKRGEKPILPLKTDSFKLWAERLSLYANSHIFLKEKDYWAKMEAIEVPEIKKDFENGSNRQKDSISLSVSLDEDETDLLLTSVNNAFGTNINDILLTALGLTIMEIIGNNKTLIALESHGREEIVTELNINRTVGWFTSIYPVLLDFSHALDLSRCIVGVKETLRKCPKGGIGYGILKYLTKEENKKGIQFQLSPQISFNYMGQFDADVERMSFQMANERVENSRSFELIREHELEVSGIIAGGRLTLSIAFSKEQYKQERIYVLLNHYKNELLRIISFCSTRQKPELTPSDLTYPHLSIETLEQLKETYQIDDIYPLSPMQEGMLFHSLYENNSSTYFEQLSYRLKGQLDIHCIERSLNELITRYDILRTAFVYKNLERPLQVVLKQRTADFSYEDIRQKISGMDTKNTFVEKKETYLEEFKQKDRQRSFNIGLDSLMRVSVIQTEEFEYEFIWSFHHILMDGWCIGILITQYLEIYTSYLENRPYALPPVQPYRTYIRWLENRDQKESANYWPHYLVNYEETAGIPRKTIATDGNIFKNQQVSFSLDPNNTVALHQLARKNQVTLNTIIQTAWGVLLSRYNSDRRDVVFGAVVSGRPPELAGVEAMVGLFINTIPVRISYQEDTLLNDLLRQVQKEALDSSTHHYYPLSYIQSATPLKYNLLDHILVFENYPISEQIEGLTTDKKQGQKAPPQDKSVQQVNQAQSAFTFSNADIFEQTNYDLTVVIVPGERLKVKFDYNANAFESYILAQAASHFERILKQVIDYEEKRIEEIEILSPEEKARLLSELNDTRIQYSSNKPIHRLFEEQVQKTPDKAAVVFENKQITYSELNKRARLLAAVIREKGLIQNEIVGIMADRSIEMIIGIMAVLIAGCAYLPLDPLYPMSRKKFILKDSKARILLTNKARFDQDRDASESLPMESILLIDDPAIYKDSLNSPQKVFEFGEMAYIIYTSGTSGNPKGVMVEHRGVVNYILWAIKQYVNNESVNFPLYTSISFDLTVTSIFTPLLSGNAIIVYDEEIDGLLILKVMKENRVGVVKLTPSHLKIIKDKKMENVQQSVKRFIVGGEELETRLTMDITEKFNENIEIYNEYGPTEATVGCMIYKFNPHDPYNSVPIGTPINNTRIYILDKKQVPVPIGISGELCVSGDGLAKGYLNKDELTNQKFIENPFVKGEKLYKTGDLARRLPNGNIEFLGRMDAQIKLRGYRIEPSEIERRLQEHNDIIEAMVLVKRKEEPGNEHLVAYFTSSKELSITTIKEFLAQNLPTYMIPSYFVKVEKIPITPNGKVDKKALLLIAANVKSEVGYVEPENNTEELIVSVWKKVLQIDKIGVYDNFFDVGGHSLLVLKVIDKLNMIFQQDIPIVTIFRYPTIHSMAQYLDDNNTRESISNEKIDSELSIQEETTRLIFGDFDE